MKHLFSELFVKHAIILWDWNFTHICFFILRYVIIVFVCIFCVNWSFGGSKSNEEVSNQMVGTSVN